MSIPQKVFLGLDELLNSLHRLKGQLHRVWIISTENNFNFYKNYATKTLREVAKEYI